MVYKGIACNTSLWSQPTEVNISFNMNPELHKNAHRFFGTFTLVLSTDQVSSGTSLLQGKVPIS